MNEFDEVIGMNLLKCIHINDSKTKFKSKVDRHECIGKGTISIDAFKLIMNDERFLDVPKILETPYFENYFDEINLLKSFILYLF
jgi:deoxyribonuclease IV